MPMTAEELDIQAREEKDEEAKKAFAEMLENCDNEPEDFIWYVPWKIILIENGKAIGDVFFKGPQNKGAVKIGFSILQGLQKQGYMTEALEILVKWAFRQKDVYTVIAETAPGNKASQKVLEKNGFTMYSNGQDGPIYKIVKKRFFLTPVLACLFLIIGIVLGFVVDGVNIFVSIGTWTVLGVVLGIVIDFETENKRKRILG